MICFPHKMKWIFHTYISSLEQIKYFRQRNFFPRFKYKSYWHWHSYQRLRQMRWIRISYRQFPWLSGDATRLPSYGMYILQLVRFTRRCTSVLDFHFKNIQMTSRLLTHFRDITSFGKKIRQFFRSYAELLPILVKYRFKNVSEGIFHPVLCFYLVYTLMRAILKRSEFRFDGLENNQTSPTLKGSSRGLYRSCTWSVYSLVNIQNFP